MRKIFLLSLFVLTKIGYGQTYTMELLFKKSSIACNEVSWSLNDFISDDYITIGTKIYTDIPNYETFKLSSNFTCPVIIPKPPCENVSIYSDEKTAIQLIKGSILSIIGCHVNIQTTNFKPNGITVNRTKTTDVCAGEDVELQALIPSTTQDFPAEAYHWQYSLDNKTTWIDVPQNFNNVKITNFTIYDILGDDHVNHFGPIDFRIGYAGRPFSTNIITVTYSPCAPVVTNLLPLQPNCSGYPTTVIVTFDRPLDATKNEKLKNFQIINKNGQLTGNQIPEISTFDITNPLQFTYNNVTGLENGEKYTTIYQAFQGAIERGVPPSNLDFPYNEPPPFTFSLSETIPLCHNTNGAVTINVSGGTSPYGYILDNETEEIDGEIVPKKIIFSGDSKTISLTPVTHSIKVTDDKGCIDKTAKD